jgi:vacuolar-type H+-ATPase subunit H
MVRDSGGGIPATEDGLESVLEIEEGLEEMLAAANREAARILEAARLASQEAEARADREVREVSQEVRSRAERDRERVIGEMSAAAAAETSGFDAVDGARVQELAAYVVSRLTGPLADRSGR